MSSPEPAPLDLRSLNQIRAHPCPACCLCGAAGEPLYTNLKDRLCGAQGSWHLKRCREPGCGLIWLDPMPIKEDIGKAYQSYFTHFEVSPVRKGRWPRHIYGFAKRGYWARKYSYGRDSAGRLEKVLGTIIQLFPLRSAALDFSIMYLPFQRNGRLLDVGCGNGQAMQTMAELGWQVQGVDFDTKAVQIARNKGLEVRLGGLEAQAYPSNFFDAITMSHLIEHVHDPVSLLTECWRILKPGGRVVIVTPNSESWGHQKFGGNWMHLDPPRHLHIFNGQSLRRLVGMVGFHLISLDATIRDADGVFIGSRSIEDTGRHRMERSHHTPFRRLWGRGMQFAEWVRLQRKSSLGEEIALVVTKGPIAQ